MSENPVAVTQALLPVIQADRDAAADYAREHWLWPAPHVEGIRIGSEAWDAYHLTQAFARHRLAGLEREADGAPGGGMGGEDVATLDVFLSAYSQYSDGELVASVILPTDDLLTLGELRRILAALTKPTPPASVSGEYIEQRLNEGGLKLVSGSPTMLQDEFARYEEELLAAAPEAATPSAVGGVDRMRESVARLLCEQHGGDPEAVATEEHDSWEGPLWTVFGKDADAIIALATGETSPDRGASRG